MSQNILIAGIGNIFLGDDAFGVEVTQRLYSRTLPEGTKVVDFGIRGFDLAYALMDERDVVLLVDAMPRGEKPGTIFVIEPDFEELDEADAEQAVLETHGMNPMKVLHMVKQMGKAGFKRLFVVGCEPSPLSSQELEEGCMGLS
ncbi:MAG: hydrogenase maturation protease, partial [Thermodesulfobacteriota bacterium]